MSRKLILFLIILTLPIILFLVIHIYNQYAYNQSIQKIISLGEKLGYNNKNHLAVGRVFNWMYYDNFVLIFTSESTQEEFQRKIDKLKLEVIQNYKRTPGFPNIPPKFTDDKVKSKLTLKKAGYSDPYLTRWWLGKDKRAIVIEFLDNNGKNSSGFYDGKQFRGNLVIIEYHNR